MCQCLFIGGKVLVPGWSQANYTSLGTSIEVLRPKTWTTSSQRTWIETSYYGLVIGIKKGNKSYQY